MRKPSTLLLTVLAVALLCANPVGAATLEELLDQTYSFQPGDTLALSNTNGSVIIGTWDRSEIRVEAVKKVRHRDKDRAQEVMDKLLIDIEQSAGRIDIETRYPKIGDSWLSGWNVSANVEYTITLPEQADLDVSTVNGKVAVEGVRGRLDVRTTNGGIRIDNAGGTVQARTTNGGIDAELRQIDAGEDLSFRTTNGSITVSLPEEIHANLTARTTNGSIRTDFPVQVVGKMSRTRIEGEINGGGGKLDLKTTNGGIKIRKS